MLLLTDIHRTETQAPALEAPVSTSTIMREELDIERSPAARLEALKKRLEVSSGLCAEGKEVLNQTQEILNSYQHIYDNLQRDRDNCRKEIKALEAQLKNN